MSAALGVLLMGVFPNPASPAFGRSAQAQVGSKTPAEPLRNGAPAQPPSDRVSLWFQNAPIEAVILAVFQMTGRDIVVSPRVTGTITLSVYNQSLEDVLQIITAMVGADYLRIGSVYYIAPREDLRALASSKGTHRLTRVARADPTQLAALLQVRFPYLTATAQPAARSLLLAGRPEDIDEAEVLVLRMDSAAPSPAPPQPEPVALELVPVTKLPAEEVAASLRQIVPDVDIRPVGNSLAVQATAPVIAQVKQYIQVLDAAPPPPPPQLITRFYRVKYISAKSAQTTLKELVPNAQVTLAPETYAPPTASFSSIGLGGRGIGGGAFGGFSGVGGIGGGGVASGVGVGGIGSSTLERSTQLILQGEAADVERALAILKQADVRPPQVEIEAKIIEVSEQQARELGIDWTAGGALDFSLQGHNGLKTSIITQDGLNLSANLNLSARLALLFEKQAAKLVASPRIVVTNNEDSSIFIGDMVRFKVLRTITEGGTQVFDVEETPVGITLLVRPRINEDGVITLKTHPAVSTFLLGPDNVPQTSTREVDTTVDLRDGDTFVIGGLIRDEERRAISRLPFLGDLPLVGKLFRHTRRDHRKSEILIMIQTRILNGIKK